MQYTIQEALKELKLCEANHSGSYDWKDPKILNVLKSYKKEMIKEFARPVGENLKRVFQEFPTNIPINKNKWINAVVITEDKVFVASDHSFILENAWEPVFKDFDAVCAICPPILDYEDLMIEVQKVIDEGASCWDVINLIADGLNDRGDTKAADAFNDMIWQAPEACTEVAYLRTEPDMYFISLYGRANSYMLEQIERWLDSTFYIYPYKESQLEVWNLDNDSGKYFSASNGDTVDDVMKEVRRLSK